MNTREKLANQYIKGEGIEIGALHNPLKLSTHAHVKYVDRMPVEELRKHYPELKDFELKPVDILDDGEKLLTIPENSLDFLIASHMIEHCQNPLGTLREHFRKLKPGGIGFYIAPNKRFTFDKDRPLTSFHHLEFDDRNGPEGSREQHYREVVTDTEKHEGDVAIGRLRYLMKVDYSIHFHVWDEKTFYAFLLEANQYLGNIFTILDYRDNGDEMIAVLIKQPDPDLQRKLHELDGLRVQRKPWCEQAETAVNQIIHQTQKQYYRVRALRYAPEIRRTVWFIAARQLIRTAVAVKEQVRRIAAL